MKQQFITVTLAFLISGMLSAIYAQQPKREVRAVWLTTIGGLDWPRTKAYNEATILQQKKELTDILDRLEAARFNTVILQTRVRSTVIYPSAIEPWDDCLTGHADKNPGYDPLRFAIEECHKRNLELHAWVVAFPGNNDRSAKALGKKAMQRRLPKLCMRANDSWMLNPGEPGTADYLASLCSEIVKNYDVDGINLDYIRYPEKEIRFNDQQTYRKYGRGMNLTMWRRSNVTRCARAIHHAVKVLKPWVRVSCSPIGKYDDLSRYSSRGWNALSTVYQDAQAWMRDGIMDMVVPMMYFQGDHFYPFAFDWQENSYGRIFVAGIGAYMLSANAQNWPLDVIERENQVTRQMGAGGQAYFRSRFVTDNTKGLYDFLKSDFYQLPAFTPALSWEQTAGVLPPKHATLEFLDNVKVRLRWDAVEAVGGDVKYNIYRSFSYPVDVNNMALLKAERLDGLLFDLEMPLSESMMPYYVVTAIDRFGNESEPVAFNEPEAFEHVRACVGQVEINGDTLLLPPDDKSEFVVITNAFEHIVRVQSYTTRIDISSLRAGVYSVRSANRKGKDFCLGKVKIS